MNIDKCMTSDCPFKFECDKFTVKGDGVFYTPPFSKDAVFNNCFWPKTNWFGIALMVVVIAVLLNDI